MPHFGFNQGDSFPFPFSGSHRTAADPPGRIEFDAADFRHLLGIPATSAVKAGNQTQHSRLKTAAQGSTFRSQAYEATSEQKISIDLTKGLPGALEAQAAGHAAGPGLTWPLPCGWLTEGDSSLSTSDSCFEVAPQGSQQTSQGNLLLQRVPSSTAFAACPDSGPYPTRSSDANTPQTVTDRSRVVSRAHQGFEVGLTVLFASWREGIQAPTEERGQLDGLSCCRLPTKEKSCSSSDSRLPKSSNDSKAYLHQENTLVEANVR